jgi:hypothetical protein
MRVLLYDGREVNCTQDQFQSWAEVGDIEEILCLTHDWQPLDEEELCCAECLEETGDPDYCYPYFS